MRFKGFSKFGGGMKAKAWGWKKKACFQERTDDDRHEHGDHDDKHGLGHFSLKKALKALDIDSDNDWKGGWTYGRIKKKKTDHDEDDHGARKWSHPIWKKRDKDDDDHTYKVKKVWPGCKTPEPEQPDPPVVPQENRAPEITAPTPAIGSITLGQKAGANILQVLAQDPDNDKLIFSIVDASGPESADGDFFTINANTGKLSLRETPKLLSSADQDSVYEVTVKVSDGQLTDTIELDIILLSGA